MIARRKPVRGRKVSSVRRQQNDPISFTALREQVKLTSNMFYVLRDDLAREEASKNSRSEILPFNGSVIRPRQ